MTEYTISAVMSPPNNRAVFDSIRLRVGTSFDYRLTPVPVYNSSTNEYTIDIDLSLTAPQQAILAEIVQSCSESKTIPDCQFRGKSERRQVDDVDTGFGDALFVAADFNLERANAGDSSTVLALYMALEAGAGDKDVLVQGEIRNPTWDWVGGAYSAIIWLDSTTGKLTQTKPNSPGEFAQKVGWATSATSLYWRPSLEIEVIS